LPFFITLRGFAKMDWGPEQQNYFKDLKQYLEHLPTLSSPEQGQPLILYVSTMHSAVNGAPDVEKEVMKDGKMMKQQLHVYFVSEVLTGSKKYYSEVENICYVVVMSYRKLRHYFEAHTIKVLTILLLNDIFGKKDCSGRLSKWVMELSSIL
jgi:hypothetical protein